MAVGYRVERRVVNGLEVNVKVYDAAEPPPRIFPGRDCPDELDTGRREKPTSEAEDGGFAVNRWALIMGKSYCAIKPANSFRLANGSRVVDRCSAKTWDEARAIFVERGAPDDILPRAGQVTMGGAVVFYQNQRGQR